VDIAGDDRLRQRYGVRIPVAVRSDTGAELSWPFKSEDLVAFLQ
jgi:hypothetical protein